MLRLMTVVACLGVVACTATTGESPAGTHPSWDGEVRVCGALRAMFHQGWTGTSVSLDTLLPDPDLYAVGALTNLAGEVTMIGGQVYLSYPDGDAARIERPARPDVGATLLVASSVPTWRSFTIEKATSLGQLGDEVARLAPQAGLNPGERLPFLMEGTFEDLHWHVIDGRRLKAGGTSHEDHLAAAVKGSIDRCTARLIGFYSENDQGVFTHMGSTTHVHCVIAHPLLAGHVDQVVIPTGTIIKFPWR